MSVALLDTNVLIKLFRGDTQIAENLKSYEKVYASTVMIGEFKAGINPDTNIGKTLTRELNGFLDSPNVEVAGISEETSSIYAEIYRELRVKGTPIPINDMWIAASAIEHHAALYSFDEHFRHVPMLKRI